MEETHNNIYTNETEEQERTGFRVTDDNTANWLVQKLRERKNEKEKFEAFYQAKLDKLNEDYLNFKSWAENLLIEYSKSEDVLFRETKTELKYQLPDGELKFKKTKKVFDKDDKILLEELKAKNLGDFIKTETKEKLDWANLKKNLTADENGTAILVTTGEILDAVKQIDQPEEFIVEF